MNNKESKNQSNQIIKFKFVSVLAMGPIVDLGVITVKDRAGRKVRVLCTDAGLDDKQEIVGIHPEIGISTYNSKGRFYEACESNFDLHIEYDLELANKKFGYDVLAASIMAGNIFGDPGQYSPVDQKIIMQMCNMLMS